MRAFLIIFFLASAFMCSAWGADQVIGAITPTDALLARATVKRPLRLGRVTTYDYTYTYTATPAYKITGIKIIDNKKIKSPAVALTGGALGSATITLRFTSQRGFGINSIVEVYGIP